MIPIKGCPPTYESIRKAFERADIELPPMQFGVPELELQELAYQASRSLRS